jgi:hypothetical protein
MASAVRYRSLIWSIFAAVGDHMLARAAGDIGLPGGVEPGDPDDGDGDGDGIDAGSDPSVLAGASVPVGVILLAGSNGPRIRGPSDSGGGGFADCVAVADCAAERGMTELSVLPGAAGCPSRRITGIGAVSSSGPTRPYPSDSTPSGPWSGSAGRA